MLGAARAFSAAVGGSRSQLRRINRGLILPMPATRSPSSGAGPRRRHRGHEDEDEVDEERQEREANAAKRDEESVNGEVNHEGETLESDKVDSRNVALNLPRKDSPEGTDSPKNDEIDHDHEKVYLGAKNNQNRRRQNVHQGSGDKNSGNGFSKSTIVEDDKSKCEATNSDADSGGNADDEGEDGDVVEEPRKKATNEQHFRDTQQDKEPQQAQELGQNVSSGLRLTKTAQQPAALVSTKRGLQGSPTPPSSTLDVNTLSTVENPKQGLDKKRRVTAVDLLDHGKRQENAGMTGGAVGANASPAQGMLTTTTLTVSRAFPSSAISSSPSALVPKNLHTAALQQTQTSNNHNNTESTLARPCCALGQVLGTWWEPFRRVHVTIEGRVDFTMEREARLLLSMAGLVESLELRETQEGMFGFAVMSRVSEAILAAELCHHQHLAQGEAILMATWAQGQDLNAEDLNRIVVTFGDEEPGISFDWVTDNIAEASGRNQAIEDAVFYRFSHLGAISSVRTLIVNNEAPNDQDFSGIAVVTFVKPADALRAVEDWSLRGPVLLQKPSIRCLHSGGDLLLAGLSSEDVAQQTNKLAPLNKRTRSASPNDIEHHPDINTSSSEGVELEETTDQPLHQSKRSKAAASEAKAANGQTEGRVLRIMNVPATSRDVIQHFVERLPGLESVKLPSSASSQHFGTAMFTSAAAAESAARSLDKLNLGDSRGQPLKLEWINTGPPSTPNSATSTSLAGPTASTSRAASITSDDDLTGQASQPACTVDNDGSNTKTGASGQSSTNAGGVVDTRKRRTKESGNHERGQPPPKHQATEGGANTRRPRSDSGASSYEKHKERRLSTDVASSFSTSSFRRGRPRPASTGRDNARRRAELELELELEAQRRTNDDNAERLADNFRSAVAFAPSGSSSTASSNRERAGSRSSQKLLDEEIEGRGGASDSKYVSDVQDTSHVGHHVSSQHRVIPGHGHAVMDESGTMRYDPSMQYPPAMPPHPHMFHASPQQPMHAGPTGYPGYHHPASMMSHGPGQAPPAGPPGHFYVHHPGHPHTAASMFTAAMPWPPPYGAGAQGVPGYAGPHQPVAPNMHMASPSSAPPTPPHPNMDSTTKNGHLLTPLRGEDTRISSVDAGSSSVASTSPRYGPSNSTGSTAGRARKDRGSSAPLETSRLYVSFSKPLPEDALKEKFDEAAPGLEYVSRHKDKCFAFVKYSSEAAAKLAVLRLNGSEVLGQPLRVSIAQPPRAGPGSHAPGSASSSSRKRQRTFDPDHRK